MNANRKRLLLTTALLLLTGLSTHATEVLAPKKRTYPAPGTPAYPPPIKMAQPEPEAAPRVKQRSDHVGFTVLAISPLGKENTFDGRFAAIGLTGRFDVPLMTFGSLSNFGIQFGFGFTVARLSLAQPAVDFMHWYLHVPLLARYRFGLSERIAIDGFAGGVLRLAEYDSRSTTDGGFRLTSPITDNIDPEFGVGLTYFFSPTMGLRLSASYLFAGVGVEWELP